MPVVPSGRGGARPVVTGRALVLGAVVILLVVVLGSPLHRYFTSRGAVGSAGQQLSNDQAELAQLKQQQAQWGDPGYIQQQARQRLEYALPGDIPYVVSGTSAPASNLSTNATAHAATRQPAGSTWNGRLWSSVQSAGAAP